jgi:hypothetical protein
MEAALVGAPRPRYPAPPVKGRPEPPLLYSSAEPMPSRVASAMPLTPDIPGRGSKAANEASRVERDEP